MTPGEIAPIYSTKDDCSLKYKKKKKKKKLIIFFISFLFPFDFYVTNDDMHYQFVFQYLISLIFSNRKRNEISFARWRKNGFIETIFKYYNVFIEVILK